MTKIKNKFGKSFDGYTNLRSDFFNLVSNDKHVIKLKNIDEFYSKQPKRTGCKLCSTKFHNELFIRNEIKYFLCENCGHLNGEYEDTEDYCQHLYSPEEGSGEMQIYEDKDREAYYYRMKKIYLPKAKFLFDQISNEGLNPNNFNFIDIGSGAGHMVAALKNIGLKNVIGYDVNAQNIEFANIINQENILKHHKLDEINKIISETKASVVTSIFMLEHVEKPVSLCKAIKENKNIKYLLLAVPMFSVGVILEQVFPHLRKRSLGAAHTHLFTEKSLQWLCKKFQFEILTNWWFGADAFDFHRFVHLHLKKDSQKSGLVEVWDKMTIPTLNNLQNAFDKQKLSSEIHMFIRVNQ